ncbi:OsmC family protein [Fervidibacillus halotolerans]|uniref:OsmC family protein n=1 Tax=Fervidibacillus halotolerans TaxID=2980027 RepID=A0A9E8LYP6_9BACI|nr:OsmC family protein [Fervidibacillus halotolerans]WAA11857.1 OsmC family protein [Fervidibacillus halotolerans]
MKAKVDWKGNMAFSAQVPSGHEIILDASKEVGGEDKGPRPGELVLAAVSGCTGIDIISIMKKMRLNPTSFHMELEGERAEEHPKKFTRIHIHYALEGDLPEDKVVRAIKLSKNKYCSVSHSLKAEIVATYSINGIKGKEEL